MSVGEEPVVAGNVANSMGLLRNDVQKWIERCRELTAEGDAPRESLREVVQTLEWTVQSLSEALAVFGCGLGVNDAEKVRPTDAAREGLAPHFVGPGVAETAREVHATAEKCSARNTSASQNRKPKRGRLLGEDGTDPYSAWLEIDTPERPLEAYALLGLTLYQENATKIEAGYARKSALLKTVQAAADRRLWNAVSNELRWARDTLLDRTKRAELNASIRRQLALDRAVGQGAEEASPDARIQCGCGNNNPARRVFCTQCGSRLWRVCGSCNSERAIDEGHCGKCGMDLDAAERQLLDGCQQKIDAALKLAKQHRYDEACHALHRLYLSEDPRLHALIEDSLELRDEIQQRRRQVGAQVTELVRQGKAFLEKHEFRKAIGQLERVPEAFRDEETLHALRAATSACEVLQKEESTIRERVKAKRLSELAGPIDRLLHVHPDHPQARKLARDVRDHLCQQAKKKLEEHDYAAVAKLLDAVPATAMNDAVIELRGALGRRSTVLKHLNTATVVSPNHVAAARWLAELSGSDAAKNLYKQARRVWEDSGKMPIAKWRAAPTSPAVGCRVAWQLNPRVELTAPCEEVFAQHPSQWFVATGLALQGLGLSRHAINFAPQVKCGLGGLLKREKSASSVWGVDVGSHSVKVVRLTRSGKDPETVIADQAYFAKRSSGDSDQALLELLTSLRDQFKWQDATLAVTFSSRFCNVRTSKLPPLDGKKLDPILQREAESLFPLDSGDIQWRCTVGDLPEDGGKFGVFSAAKNSVLQQELAFWEALGVTPKVLTPDAFAARNAWAFGNDDADGAHAVIDVGDSHAVFSLEDRGQMWVRVLLGVGRQATDLIAHEMKVTRQQAEALKEDFSKADDLRPMFDGVQGTLQQLQAEVSRTLEGISREEKSTRCESLTCIGGAALTTGLVDALR